MDQVTDLLQGMRKTAWDRDPENLREFESKSSKVSLTKSYLLPVTTYVVVAAEDLLWCDFMRFKVIPLEQGQFVASTSLFIVQRLNAVPLPQFSGNNIKFYSYWTLKGYKEYIQWNLVWHLWQYSSYRNDSRSWEQAISFLGRHADAVEYKLGSWSKTDRITAKWLLGLVGFLQASSPCCLQPRKSRSIPAQTALSQNARLRVP